MVISATGIVVDHYGDVLLIQRDDTRTLAPPGGAANIGELPPDTAAREVREETGLVVMPVRLVGLYFLPTKPTSYLALVFRCIMRGGEINTSEESPRVGFFKSNPLPKPMLDIHAQRIQRSLAHKGGPPDWDTNQLSYRLRLGNLFMNGAIYPWLHFRRKRAGLPPYKAPPTWKAKSTVIVRDIQGKVLWTRDRGDGSWNLPGSGSSVDTPPWETAAHSLKANTGMTAKLRGLSGVYPAADKPEMTFTFTADSIGNPRLSPVVEIAFFAPGQEPENRKPEHAAFVADAIESEEAAVFRHYEPARTKSTSE